ncbi:MAG: hypothetical protein NWR72_11265 [Bacteroidia bacterium]|nr:hypothetical protein [Bacteroidia bacterium]
MNRMIFLLLILSLSACDRPSPEPEVEPGRVLILNEGGFQQSTSSISRYNDDTKVVSQDVFAAENGYNPGDVLQSATLIDGDLYLVVNNSGRIIVCDTDSLSETRRVDGFTSPRYLVHAGNGVAYLSDLFGGSISKIEVSTLDVLASIPLMGWSEEMMMIDNRLWIANQGAGKLYVLDPATDSFVDSVEVGPGAANLELDAEGKVWVLCQGDFFTSADPSLFRVDPMTREVLTKVEFPSGAGASDLCLTRAKDQLLFLQDGQLQQLAISASTLPPSRLFASGSSFFYSLGVDPVSGEIYLGDAGDFVQRGNVFRLSPAGVPIDTFQAGIIPGEFFFLDK